MVSLLFYCTTGGGGGESDWKWRWPLEPKNEKFLPDDLINIELFREGGSAPCYITQLHDGEDDILADVLFFEVPRRVES